MPAENLQALHQGEASIDHGGELAGKHNHILASDLGLEYGYVFEKILWFWLDDYVFNAQPFQVGPSSCFVNCFQLSLAPFAMDIFSFPDINGHARIP